MSLKNTAFSLIIFLLVSNTCFSGGFIKAGQTFKATEDVRYFNKQESIDLLNKLSRLEALEKAVFEYKANEKNYKEGLKHKDEAIASLRESITFYEFSIKQYKSLIENLKALTESQNKSMIELTKTIMDVKRSGNFKAKTNFFTGFLAPIAGAWGLSRIK